MKLRINLKEIIKLNPCLDRLNNYVHHYGNKTFSLKQFLALKNITHHDKLWVILKLVDDDTREFFLLDCSFTLYAHAFGCADDAVYVDIVTTGDYSSAAYAAHSAAADYVATAHVSVACAAAEQQRQIQSLLYLIEGKL